MGIFDRRHFLEAGAVSAASLVLPRSLTAATPNEAERYWPQWRGPMATGEGPQARPPLEWAEGKNVRFKVELPGEGKGTPILWRDLLFVTAAVPDKTAPTTAPTPTPPPAEGQGDRRPSGTPPGGILEFVVIALDRKDGKVRWQRTVKKELPHEGHHNDGSFAPGSALTDGQRLYAFFGSRGLYALDLEGRVLWDKNLGEMKTRNAFGEGASPAVFGDTLVVNWDHEGADFIVALDAKTGRERWRKERDEPTTWATPLIVTEKGQTQVVVGAPNGVRGYDLANGQLLWEAPGLTANTIPSPVAADGMVYAMSGFRGNALRAVRLSEAKGLLSGPPGLVFTYDKDTPYVPSPLLYRGGLYFLKSNSGILTRLDARTGAANYTERIDAVPNVYASPVGADGRIYLVGREGTTVVLEAGTALKVLATNTLEDGFDASPALGEADLFLRGRKHLYRIAV